MFVKTKYLLNRFQRVVVENILTHFCSMQLLLNLASIMKKLYFILFFLILVSASSKAQYSQLYVISSAGDTYSSNNLVLSWSVGELVVETLESDNIILTQGFHQGLLNALSIQEADNSDIEKIEIYPNPASEFIYVKLNKEMFKVQELPDKIALYNNQGKLLFMQPIVDINTTINIKQYSSGIFYLRFSSSSSNYSKTYIIQKQGS